jgi:glycyl-tRNA synthetase
VPALLDELHLQHAEVQVMGTPRRIVVSVKGVAGRQPDRESMVKGPPAARAFDATGQATKAAEGFAKSRGLNVSDLQVMEVDGGSYVTARVFEAGRPALEVLAEALPGLIAGIRFERAMRWNASGVAFSRPIRWLLALLGGQPIVFEYAGLQSGQSTRGLRFTDPETLTIDSAEQYFKALAGQGIRVNAIAPALMLPSGEQDRANFAAVHELNPLRRGVEIGDVVAALRFLIDSASMTGQTLALDGGQRFMNLKRDVQFLEGLNER